MADVFTYGSLVFAEVMEAVTGASHPARPAKLADHRRRRLAGRPYPGIVECAGEHTHGVIYAGVDDEGLAWLDAFEGDLYDRRLVRVDAGDAESASAYAYVLKPQHAHLLEALDWDREAFEREHHAGWVAACRRFRAGGPASVEFD